MRRILGTLAAAVVAGTLASCASSAPKLKVGWDEHVDFSKYHTWAWRPDGSIQDPVWAKRCQDVLSDQLRTNGLKQVGLDQNPDLWGVVHARLSSKTVVYSYTPAWGYAWGGWAPLDTFETEIPVGTLVIDLVDAHKKEAVWRGRAEGAMDPDKSNEEREQKLIGILQQLFVGYPPAPSSAPPPKS